MLCYLDDVTNSWVSQLSSRVQISLKEEERDEVGREKILPHLIKKNNNFHFQTRKRFVPNLLTLECQAFFRGMRGFGKGNNSGNLPSFVGNDSIGPPASEDILFLA